MSDWHEDSLVPESARSQAVELSSIGMNAVAWPSSAAITVLEERAAAGMAVLGGDIIWSTPEGLCCGTES